MRLVDRPTADITAGAAAAAASVRSLSWDEAGRTVEAVVRRTVEEDRT